MRISLLRRQTRRYLPRAGSAMVEVAVCFPVFLLVLMGIIEFGRAMSINQMLNSAARIGCRTAILDGSTNSDVENRIKQHVVSTLGCQTSSVNVAIKATSDRTGATLPNVSQATTGDCIKIDVYVLFADVSWSVKKWMAASKIRGECSMQHE